MVSLNDLRSINLSKGDVQMMFANITGIDILLRQIKNNTQGLEGCIKPEIYDMFSKNLISLIDEAMELNKKNGKEFIKKVRE